MKHRVRERPYCFLCRILRNVNIRMLDPGMTQNFNSPGSPGISTIVFIRQDRGLEKLTDLQTNQGMQVWQPTSTDLCKDPVPGLYCCWTLCFLQWLSVSLSKIRSEETCASCLLSLELLALRNISYDTRSLKPLQKKTLMWQKLKVSAVAPGAAYSEKLSSNCSQAFN